MTHTKLIWKKLAKRSYAVFEVYEGGGKGEFRCEVRIATYASRDAAIAHTRMNPV